VRDVVEKYRERLEKVSTETDRGDRLCEFNVIEQVMNVSQTTILEDCWARGQQLSVHGWIYGIEDGILRDLDVCITGPDDIGHIHKMG